MCTFPRSSPIPVNEKTFPKDNTHATMKETVTFFADVPAKWMPIVPQATISEKLHPPPLFEKEVPAKTRRLEFEIPAKANSDLLPTSYAKERYIADCERYCVSKLRLLTAEIDALLKDPDGKMN